jgi:hypothetical protein
VVKHCYLLQFTKSSSVFSSPPFAGCIVVNFILRRPQLFAGLIVKCVPHISAEIMLGIKALGTGIIHLNKYLFVHMQHTVQ